MSIELITVLLTVTFLTSFSHGPAVGVGDGRHGRNLRFNPV